MISDNTPIYKLWVSDRIRETLSRMLRQRGKPTNFGEAVKLSKEELLAQPNFGKFSWASWSAFVQRNHRPEPPMTKDEQPKRQAATVVVKEIKPAEMKIDPTEAVKLLEIARLNNMIGGAYAAISAAQTDLAKLYLGEK